MNKFLMPALGAAVMLGAPQALADDGIVLSQLMLQGQPGVTGNVNRTVPPGNPGVSPLNVPAPSPYASPSYPTTIQPTPFIGERGELNLAEPEMASPAERDEGGRLRPSVDRTRARFAGERGPDGKILPTYTADQRVQAQPGPRPPTVEPQAPPPSQLQRERPAAQPGTTQPDTTPRRPGSGDMGQPAQPSGQSQMGTSATGQADRSMQRSQSQDGKAQMKSGHVSRSIKAEADTTAVLNKLSAEGYTPTSKIERVGNAWQTTAMKEGKQVTVQVDPQTNRIIER